ncbi:MAG: DNA mismatch repair endonuclease MutL [Deltaproteobacteria bacterium]|nr:DNA mismatch repair endonuclease MutL [Deltaproteobacteria bacterium]
MAGSIRILEDALVNQIAAGEVVERPANVVKELLENAIDAGAKTISIEVDKGGVSLVRVTDDGLGMSPRDLEMSLKRHATSKLRSSEDLVSISTLGFRGEALPSIASVSRFTITSRQRDQLSGTSISVEGGVDIKKIEAGCAPGTIVEVRDLFYNVPARRKFLKSRTTENAHIATACLRIALAFPELRITFTRDERDVQQFLPTTSFFERVTMLFPGETFVPIAVEGEGIRIIAALGAPERARAGMSHLHLFVNHRPVRDTALSRAVVYAYGSVLAPGRYPIGAVRVEIPPSEVDVNVHPQKLEVRFANERIVLDDITRLIAKQLGTSAWRGPMRRGAFPTQRFSDQPPADSIQQPGSYEIASGFKGATGSQESENDPWGLRGSEIRGADYRHVPLTDSRDNVSCAQSASQASLLATGFFASLRVLGQVRRVFLVCEGRDALYIIDQHAADERVKFNRLRKSYHAGEVLTQRLLFPERVECNAAEMALVEEHQANIYKVGLDFTAVGPTTVALRSTPALLNRASPERLFRDLLIELGHSGERAFEDAIDMALATMACHGAIRAGDPLSVEQATALLRALDEESDFVGHCPHGRPVVYSITLSELERKLGR